MGNSSYKHDENFHKVHPDLAALFKEVEKIERSLLQLKVKKKSLKEELKSTKNELAKRLKTLEAWQMRAEKSKTSIWRRRSARK